MKGFQKKKKKSGVVLEICVGMSVHVARSWGLSLGGFGTEFLSGEG